MQFYTVMYISWVLSQINLGIFDLDLWTWQLKLLACASSGTV